VTGETLRISRPRISDDGNTVAFLSAAFNLVGNDVNGAPDVFVRDVAAATTERVSVGRAGGEADLGSTDLALSGNGHVVASPRRRPTWSRATPTTPATSSCAIALRRSRCAPA
jgi:hypothetical protein